jgi:hypothetical protein
MNTAFKSDKHFSLLSVTTETRFSNWQALSLKIAALAMGTQADRLTFTSMTNPISGRWISNPIADLPLGLSILPTIVAGSKRKHQNYFDIRY